MCEAASSAVTSVVEMSSWTERQGQVGDLTKHCKEELQDLLQRQDKILSNKRLLQTLPDKGRKLQDFREKIQQALEHREEDERKQRLVSAARTEFQSKYQQAFTAQHRPVHNNTAAALSTQGDRDSAVVSMGDVDQTQLERSAVAVVNPTSQNSDHTTEAELVEALGRVKLGKESHNNKATDNYFIKPPSVPHYLTVIEKNENSPSSRKSKFKTNQLLSKDDVSPSGSSSPNHSSGTSSPLSAEARRERDRKHLDDITAAKLPPLHHSPAQLLTLEESAALLKEQTTKQQVNICTVTVSMKFEFRG